MLTVALVTLIILLQYNYFTIQVGRARGSEIKAPATSGSELFDRRLRVQLNTLEQLIVTPSHVDLRLFLPSRCSRNIGNHLYSRSFFVFVNLCQRPK